MSTSILDKAKAVEIDSSDSVPASGRASKGREFASLASPSRQTSLNLRKEHLPPNGLAWFV